MGMLSLQFVQCMSIFGIVLCTSLEANKKQESNENKFWMESIYNSLSKEEAQYYAGMSSPNFEKNAAAPMTPTYHDNPVFEVINFVFENDDERVQRMKKELIFLNELSDRRHKSEFEEEGRCSSLPEDYRYHPTEAQKEESSNKTQEATSSETVGASNQKLFDVEYKLPDDNKSMPTESGKDKIEKHGETFQPLKYKRSNSADSSFCKKNEGATVNNTRSSFSKNPNSFYIYNGQVFRFPMRNPYLFRFDCPPTPNVSPLMSPACLYLRSGTQQTGFVRHFNYPPPSFLPPSFLPPNFSSPNFPPPSLPPSKLPPPSLPPPSLSPPSLPPSKLPPPSLPPPSLSTPSLSTPSLPPSKLPPSSVSSTNIGSSTPATTLSTKPICSYRVPTNQSRRY